MILIMKIIVIGIGYVDLLLAVMLTHVAEYAEFSRDSAFNVEAASGYAHKC